LKKGDSSKKESPFYDLQAMAVLATASKPKRPACPKRAGPAGRVLNRFLLSGISLSERIADNFFP
jgi:hypothetical protein